MHKKHKPNPVAPDNTVRPSVRPGARSSKTPRIVGIGASAGGLEAIERLLQNVPPACDLAFVIVQHLDPTHKGIMAELLQHNTAMPVVQITDRTRVKADHVYIIPPNCDLSILHGVLHLLKPAAPRGLHLPIDFFFRALAEDQQEQSIGVILSGMGSDGTLGLRAIKGKAGTVFVQSLDSAEFDGMPRNAIEAGLADAIASPEALPGLILAYLQHPPLLLTRSEDNLPDKDQSGLEKIILILRAQTGHDFSLYKKSPLCRRIERRMSLHQLSKIVDYACYMRENPQETILLFKEVLIGVTSFFRDRAAWEQLKNEIIPALLAARPNGGTLRAWVTACSTGEEAYSLAIVFREALEQIRQNAPAIPHALQIFATDLDPDAIEKARAAVYSTNIVADVTEDRLRRFFVQDERGYRVSKEIREMVIFAPQNLVMDPPFTKLDLLTCRNLLIYLEASLQKKLLPLFHYSLNPGGFLMLGSSETIGSATGLFAALPGKTRLYRRKDNAPCTVTVEFPVAAARKFSETTAPQFTPQMLAPSANAASTANSVQAQTDALLLQRFSPAAVLTSRQGDIVYISGKTGKYLEPAAGKANLNVFSMAREGLAVPLNAAFAKALRQQEAVTLKNLAVGTNGGTQYVNVTLQALAEPPVLKDMLLIVFTDLPTPRAARTPDKAAQAAARNSELSAMAQELQQSREEIQTTREEMQTSQEELKSTNEELQSTNEELQSTNEELQTLNHELTAKVDELSQASDDMKNLLNSTGIATLFLDEQLRIRRFTTPTASIFKLIPGDAGRPITDFASELDYPQLSDSAREVLRSLLFREEQVTSRDGRWFSVRITPYRTQTNRIDGVAITFMDISTSKALETTLRQTLAILQAHCNEQATALDATGRQEKMLHQAQILLEHRLADLTQQTQQRPFRENMQETLAGKSSKP